MQTEYIYRGARDTAPELKNKPCTAVRRHDGKCFRGRNGSMLVQFESGAVVVVIGKLLRKIKK